MEDQKIKALNLLALRTARGTGRLAKAKAVEKGNAQSLKIFIRRAEDGGVAEVLWEGRRARAAVLIGWDTPYYATSKQDERPTCRIALDWTDRGAKAWAKRQVVAHSRLFGKDFVMHLNALHRSLLPAFEDVGLHVTSLVLAGRPAPGLAGLKRRYGDLKWEAHTDLQLAPLATAAEIDAVVKIHKQEFGRHPEYGPDVPTPQFCAWMRRTYGADIKRGLESNFVVKQGSRVVGWFGFGVHDPGFLGHRSAGVGITFGREAQGLGLAKVAYAVMLRRMVQLRIGYYVGSTARESVMHLSKIMGRKPVAYELRAGKPAFPLFHFSYSQRVTN